MNCNVFLFYTIIIIHQFIGVEAEMKWNENVKKIGFDFVYDVDSNCFFHSPDKLPVYFSLD